MKRTTPYKHTFALIAMAAAACLGSFGISAASAPKNVVRHYHANGRLYGEYEIDSQGLAHGLARVWYGTGALQSEAKFDHGQWVFTRNYSPNGKLTWEKTEGADFLPIVKAYAD